MFAESEVHASLFPSPPEAEEGTSSTTLFALLFNEEILPGPQFVLHDSI